MQRAAYGGTSGQTKGGSHGGQVGHTRHAAFLAWSFTVNEADMTILTFMWTLRVGTYR